MHRSFIKKLFSVHFCLEKFYLCGFEQIKRSVNLYQNYASNLELMVNFNTTEKAVHVSKRLVHSELFYCDT